MQAIGLKTHIWNNAAKTVLLLLGFPFLMSIVCYAFALLWVGFMEDPEVLQGLGRALDLLPAVLPVALAVSGVWLPAFAFFAHQWMIDKLTGAQEVDREREPRLYNLVENLAISRGLPVPDIRIIEQSALNAYASGIRREHYAITVTRGLLDELDEAKLEAVLARELTHIRNGDVRLIVVAAVFAGLISLIGDLLTRDFGRGGRTVFRLGGGSSSRSSSKKGGGGALLHPDRNRDLRPGPARRIGAPHGALPPSRIHGRRRRCRTDEEPRRHDRCATQDRAPLQPRAHPRPG